MLGENDFDTNNGNARAASWHGGGLVVNVNSGTAKFGMGTMYKISIYDSTFSKAYRGDQKYRIQSY